MKPLLLSKNERGFYVAAASLICMQYSNIYIFKNPKKLNLISRLIVTVNPFEPSQKFSSVENESRS